jgi:transposase
MRPYSLDLRERVLEDCDGGMLVIDVAKKYRVSTAWIRRLRQRRRQNGNIAPKARGPNRQTKLAPHRDELARLVQETPDATLEELRSKLPVRVSIGTLWHFLDQMKLRFKKRSVGRRSRIGPTSKSSGRNGSRSRRSSTRSGWFSSTKPGPPPT